MAEPEKAAEPEMKGAFVASLKRNNRQIKDDRAEAIAEDAQMRYRRTVEDLDMEIKRMKRKRDNMLDMSPENSLSLMVADNFDSAEFVDRDVKLGIDIRNAEIKLKIAQEQYNHLFEGSK
jgi:hypothetical protein